MLSLAHIVKSNRLLAAIAAPVARRLPNDALLRMEAAFIRLQWPVRYAGKILARNRDDKIRVNIGSGGYWIRRDWKNLDHPSAHYKFTPGLLDYQFDLTSGEPFPFESGSVDRFYCSHTVEHIPADCLPHILREVHRCLKPGGAVRITTPNVDLAIEAYRTGNIAFFKNHQGETIENKLLFFFATYFYDKTAPNEVRENFASMSKVDFLEHYRMRIPLRSQIEHTGNHINWFTNEKLSALLRRAGFANVYTSSAHKSAFPDMRGGDKHNGFDSTVPGESIFVEAVK